MNSAHESKIFAIMHPPLQPDHSHPQDTPHRCACHLHLLGEHPIIAARAISAGAYRKVLTVLGAPMNTPPSRHPLIVINGMLSTAKGALDLLSFTNNHAGILFKLFLSVSNLSITKEIRDTALGQCRALCLAARSSVRARTIRSIATAPSIPRSQRCSQSLAIICDVG